MKRSAMWWEGAEWARSVIGQSEGDTALGVCDNIVNGLDAAQKPQDYKDGARALVAVARTQAAKYKAA